MLTRRTFVQTVGTGVAAYIGARGRENSLWSALEPTLEAVAPGMHLPLEQREPAGARPGRARRHQGRVRSGGRATRPLRRHRRRADRRDRQEAGRQAREHRPRLRLDADPALVHAPVHGEGQGAGRHDPDLRGVRRLRRDDGPSGASGRARRRLQDRSRRVRRRRARAPGWCSTATRTTRPRPTSARARRASSSPRSRRTRPTPTSWSTRPTSTTSPIPITTRTSRSRSRTRT